MEIKLTFREDRCELSRQIDPLEMTAAETYALGAMNAVNAMKKRGAYAMPRKKATAKTKVIAWPVAEVVVTLNDMPHGGVSCASAPSFARLAAMAESGAPMTKAHMAAMAGLVRIFGMSRGER